MYCLDYLALPVLNVSITRDGNHVCMIVCFMFVCLCVVVGIGWA